MAKEKSEDKTETTRRIKKTSDYTSCDTLEHAELAEFENKEKGKRHV